MRQRKNGLRLLGLLAVAALAVMAFASSAQAHKFLVNKGFLLATAGGNFEAGTVGTMLVGGGLNFQLSCTTFATDEGHISTATHGKAVLLYSGCTTLVLKTATEIGCDVKEPIKAEALLLPTLTTGGKPAILAEKISALILLHSNKFDAKWPLGTLPCVLPLDNTVTGELCLEITGGNDTVTPLVVTDDTTQGKCDERPTLEALTEGAGLKDKLKYGTQEVTLDSKAEVFLTGAHNGQTLGVSA